MKVVAVDNGSGTIKVGLAGDDRPTAVIPAWITISKTKGEWIVGEEAVKLSETEEAKSSSCLWEKKRPFDWGIIRQWEAADALWKHALAPYDMKEHYLIMTERSSPCIRNPTSNREKLTELAMESYSCLGFYLYAAPMTALFACGRTTGVVVDSGFGVTEICCGYEGYSLPHAGLPLNVNGEDITSLLQQYLNKRGISNVPRAVVDEIKVAISRVPLRGSKDIDPVEGLHQRLGQLRQERDRTGSLISSLPEELYSHLAKFTTQGYKDTEYTLPDGRTISFSSEGMECGNYLFEPTRVDSRLLSGLPTVVNNSIEKCDPDIKRDLFKNIILAGGNTLMPGFRERLQLELQQIYPAANVIAPEERLYSAWI